MVPTCNVSIKNTAVHRTHAQQVYRATLASGEVVAVKVQRPDVLESVTLDLYVIRLILLFISKNDSTRESALSILGVIDNWADRFLQELDYVQEAMNGDRFVCRPPSQWLCLCAVFLFVSAFELLLL